MSPILRKRLWRYVAAMSVVCLGAEYGWGQETPSDPTPPSPSTNQLADTKSLGFQPRHGDEIMVCGQLYRIGTPVKLWIDAEGFDAYRTTRRFSDFDRRDWKSTVDDMKAGKVEFGSSPQEFSPDRFGLRFGGSASTAFTPHELEQVRGGGWSLPLLQDKVDQFVLHFDVCGTAAQCFYILHDRRGLSVHFLLDVDGTIYQTLDLKERAWHATKSNDRSIGIEIANIGAYPINEKEDALAAWYQSDTDGKTFLTFPNYVRGASQFRERLLRPRRNNPIRGKIGDAQYRQYDYTPQQYAALIRLSAALCDIFPNLRPEAPRMPDGKVFDRTLTDEQWATFRGILGHYHVQPNKSDPGPAMDWDYLLEGVREQLDAIRRERSE
ncbi:MAG: N-acetylmuramoyl-L-alanine amidase [Planctomycetota bacterium]